MSLTVLLEDRPVPYSIRISRRVRRLKITVGPDGLEVVLPRRGTPRQIEPFLHHHAGWILKHLDRFERRKARMKEASLPAGTILFRGAPVRVELIGDQAADFSVEHVSDVLRVTATRDSAAMFDEWIHAAAAAEIGECVRRRSAEMEASPARVTIRDQKSRWGSCSRLRNVAFNWRLVMAPPEVLDYVVVHELAHLLELSHSRRFWRIVECFSPDFAPRRKWLRENGELLLHPYETVLSLISARY